MDAVLDIVIPLAITIITGISGILVKEVKTYLDDKKIKAKYNLDNEIIERLLQNAVDYAEGYAIRKLKDYSGENNKIKSIKKQEAAITYFIRNKPNDIDTPNKLGEMIDRKVSQTFLVK